MTDESDFIKKLEIRGESGVREDLAKSRYTSGRIPQVRNWLEEKDKAGEERLRLDEIDLEKEANKYLKEANEHAKHANRIAGGAFVVALVALAASLYSLWRSLP